MGKKIILETLYYYITSEEGKLETLLNILINK